jgi:hypothetical protein
MELEGRLRRAEGLRPAELSGTYLLMLDTCRLLIEDT